MKAYFRDGRVIAVAVGSFIIFLVAFYLASATGSWAAADEEILPGVSINGVDVGGMPPSEASQLIRAEADKILERKLTLMFADQKQQLSLKQLGVFIPVDEVVDRALLVGHESSWWQRMKQRYRLRHSGYNISLPLRWNEGKITQQVRLLAKQINRMPKNAQLSYQGDEVLYTPAKTGIRVKVEETVAALVKILPLQGKGYVSVVTEPIWPQVTSGQLRQKGISGLMAKYVTKFNPYNKPRVENIRVAAGHLDGTEIAPGETFSFNDSVGQRTAKRGYREALIIQNNEFVPGLGGGVCQVSSTLYNAVLRANLPVVERRRHSLLVSYVPLGLDATVAYGAIDLRFTNDSDGYVVIKTEVDQDSITIRVFGAPLTAKVNLKSILEKKVPYQTVIKEDNSIPQGKSFVEQKGIPGYQVRVEQQVLENGQIISEKMLSRDYYPSQKKVVRVGTELSNDS